jgi:hypothetical protein
VKDSVGWQPHRRWTETWRWSKREAHATIRGLRPPLPAVREIDPETEPGGNHTSATYILLKWNTTTGGRGFFKRVERARCAVVRRVVHLRRLGGSILRCALHMHQDGDLHSVGARCVSGVLQWWAHCYRVMRCKQRHTHTHTHTPSLSLSLRLTTLTSSEMYDSGDPYCSDSGENWYSGVDLEE